MKLKDYLPLKAICEDVGVSRWTLWRAAASDIPGFPKPTKVGGQIFWKKTEIDALESALLRFQGRCAFDRERRHAKKLKALTKATTKTLQRKEAPAASQRDLFS
jgi:predicted DNA-binding transcriptional regulator AlpA